MAQRHLLLVTYFNSLQVHRALLFSQTGELQVPKGKDGEFSQTNWGDYEFEASSKDKNRPAKTKVKRRATIFQSRINSLSDEHWAAIMDGAHLYMGTKKSSITKEKIREKTEGMSDEDEDNTMLVDPMFG